MNIFVFLQDLCYRLFYGHSMHQATSLTYNPTQAKTSSPEVVTKMHFHYQASFQATPLTSRTFAPSTSDYSPNITPFNPNIATAPATTASQTPLSHSLQSQVHELKKERQTILAEIAIKRSEQTPLKAIFSSSHLMCDENIKKHKELSQLNSRLEETSDFCNQEMIEVLDLVTEGSTILDEKLVKLRKKAAFAIDDAELCENVERIAILEKALDTVHQLEAQFQKMQKTTTIPNSKVLPTKEEIHISSLIEEIEKLSQQKQFLNACKQSLPLNGAYDIEELETLLQLFESEGQELAQKTKEAKHKLKQAEQFAHELTNHLLDYAEIFKDHLQKLENRPHIIKPVVTRLNLNYTTQAKVQSATDTFDSDPLKAAALKVTEALKELMQLDSEV